VRNKNAVIGWLTSMATTGILWIAAKRGLHLSTATAVLVAGAAVGHASALVLWIGKYGIRAGLRRAVAFVKRIWLGQDAVPVPVPPPPPPPPPAAA